MRKLLLILALLACASTAHAASCGSSGAGCVQQKSAGAATGANLSIAYDSNNIAGNTDFIFSWTKCATTTSSPLSFADTNGNTWNSSNDSVYSTNDPKIQVNFAWALSVHAGANTVTITNAAADCQILVAMEFEYSGIIQWNSSGGIRTNDQFMPFPPINTSTSFPINANQSWGVPSQTDTAFVCGIHDGANTGTWSITAGWNQVASSSVTNAAQISCWDSIANVAPSAISVSNTSGAVTHAIGEWMIFNRQSTPANQSPQICSNQGNSVSSLSCQLFLTSGQIVALGGQGNGIGTTGVTFSSSCGTPVGTQESGGPGYLTGIAVLKANANGLCTLTAVSTGSGGSRNLSMAAISPPGANADNSVLQIYPFFWPGTTWFDTTIPVYPITTDTSNSIQIAYVFGGGSGFTNFACNGTNYSVAFNIPAPAAADPMAGCYRSGITQGATTDLSVAETSGSHKIYAEFIIRTMTPTFGHIQSVVCPTAIGPQTCPLLFPVSAGDSYITETLTAFPGGFAFTTSTDGLIGEILPGNKQQGLDSYYFPNGSASDPGLTTAWPAGTSGLMVVSEYRGFSSTRPYADGTTNMGLQSQYGGAPVTTWPSGPIHVLRGGTYDLHSAVVNTNQTVTGQAGFAAHVISQSDSMVNLVSDQVVNPISQSDYNFTATWARAINGPHTSLFAFAATPYTLPKVEQASYVNGCANSCSIPTLNTTRAGSHIVMVCGVSDAAGSSWSLTATDGAVTPIALPTCGITGNLCAAWDIGPVTGGSFDTMTVTTGDNSPSVCNYAEISGVSAFQAGTSQSSTTLTASTGNVTTSNPTSYILSAGTACCDFTQSWLYCSDPDATLVQQGYQDSGGVTICGKTVLSPGTWSNSFTRGGGTAAMNALIVPLTLNPITPTIAQPFVNLITKNDPSRYMGEWRK